MVSVNHSSTSALCNTANFDGFSRWSPVSVGITLAILCVGGLCGNLVSIVILTKRYLKNSIFKWYLDALCAADCLTLLSQLFAASLPVLITPYQQKFGDAVSYVNICVLLFYPLGMIGQSLSTWFTVAISFVRFVGVQFPLADTQISRQGRAKLIICIVMVTCIAFNVPRFFELTSVQCFDATNSIHLRSELSVSVLRLHRAYRFIYLGWMYSILMFAAPFLLLLLLNALIVRVLVTGFHGRRILLTKDGQSQQQKLISFLLLSIALVFLVCRVPLCVNSVLEIFQSEEAAMNQTALPHGLPPTVSVDRTGRGVPYDLSAFLVALNASCNFALYMLFSGQFRQQVGKSLTALQAGLQMAVKVTMLPLIYNRAVPRHHSLVPKISGDLTHGFQIEEPSEPSENSCAEKPRHPWDDSLPQATSAV